MKIKQFLASVSLIVSGFFVFTSVAQACSCMAPGTPVEEAAHSDLVFTGTAQTLGGTETTTFIKMDILQSWKGIEDAAHVVTVETTKNSAACGFNFTTGEAYLVYANYVRDDAGEVLTNSNNDKRISVTLCSRTHILDDNIAAEIALLDDAFESDNLTTNDDVASVNVDTNFSFVAMPREVIFGSSVTLAWDVPGARWCLAGGDWHGPRGTSGEKVIKKVEGNMSFSLRCFYGIVTSKKHTVDVNVYGAADSSDDISVACTEDAHICADGTVVGRTGPNCEFVCPKEPPVMQNGCEAPIDTGILGLSFALPINPFTKQSLINIDCNEDIFSVRVGSESHDRNYYIWHRGYYTTDGNTFRENQSIRLRGPRNASGEWIVGAGLARIPRVQMNDEAQYFAFYMCIRQDGEWQCGCSEEGACSVPEEGVFRWNIAGLNNDAMRAPENPELPGLQMVVPEGCVSWYDGCNTCGVMEDGTLGPCTLRACFQHEEPYCLAYVSGHDVCTKEYKPVCGGVEHCLCADGDLTCNAPCEIKEKTFANKCLAEAANATILHKGACLTKKSIPSGECRPTGCSGQICADEDVMSTCEWTDAYACYKNPEITTCSRQSDGTCGWTDTKRLAECLASPPSIAQQSCEAKGGTWGYGSMPIPQCYMPTADAGKKCTDSDQCKEFCEIDDVTQTVGKCSATTPFDGCAKTLKDGKFAGEICT